MLFNNLLLKIVHLINLIVHKISMLKLIWMKYAISYNHLRPHVNQCME